MRKTSRRGGMMTIVEIDNREKRSRIEHAKQYYGNDNVEVKELPFGDYIFKKQVVFEYKTISDFIQSVKSGRVFNQAVDQSSVFKFHFIIIVGSDRDVRNYISKLRFMKNTRFYFDERKFIGAIARLNTYTTVLRASNETEAFYFMKTQARKCLDNKHIIKRLEAKTDNPAFNFLMNIKHISDTKADLIVNHLNLYTLEDLLNVTNDDLQKIPGIGSATAGIIQKALWRKS